jgi:hypothetical protein
MRPKGRTKLLIYIIAMFSLIFISFHSPVLEQLESDLGNHMIIEHALFLSIGYLSIMVSESILKVVFNKRKKVSEYGVRQSTGIQALINCWTSFVRSLYTITRNGLFPMACAIIIVIFWHMPSIFDLSLYNQSIHIVQHFSFTLVGVLFFLSLRQLGQSLVLFLIISSVGMMLVSGMGLAITNERIYVPYTISSHNIAGEYMLGLSIAIAVIALPVYLIRRTLLHISTITKSSSQVK